MSTFIFTNSNTKLAEIIVNYVKAIHSSFL